MTIDLDATESKLKLWNVRSCLALKADIVADLARIVRSGVAYHRFPLTRQAIAQGLSTGRDVVLQRPALNLGPTCEQWDRLAT